MSTATCIFTEQELDLLATPLSIRLERAAKSREVHDIPAIRELMDIECLAIYDPYIQWVGVLQTFVVQNAGQAEHDEALRQAAEYAFRPFVLQYKGLTVRQRVEALARHLRAAGSTFWLEEEERRIRFRLDPWGGGVRQWREPAVWQQKVPRKREGSRYVYPFHGSYRAPTSFTTLSGARPLTQGREELPCFFAAEILYFEIQPIELLGLPLAVVTIPRSPEEPAYLDVYKDAADIPEEAYERVGMAKPKRGLPAEPPGRIFTDEELERLATPLSLQVEAAAEAHDCDRLLHISSGMDVELVGAKDPLGILIAGLLTWIARHLGEGEAERALERTAEVVMAPFIEAVRDLDVADSIRLWSVAWRAHGSTFGLEEREDTFVFRGRPLGACARMWAHAYQPRVERISESRVRYPTFGCYDPPASFHLMREPRGITYGKVGYPIYSCHCHMLHEIYAIDQVGYPLWTEEHPLHDRDGETFHIHYKNPADWPERYYTRVGREKPASPPGWPTRPELRRAAPNLPGTSA